MASGTASIQRLTVAAVLVVSLVQLLSIPLAYALAGRWGRWINGLDGNGAIWWSLFFGLSLVPCGLMFLIFWAWNRLSPALAPREARWRVVAIVVCLVAGLVVGAWGHWSIATTIFSPKATGMEALGYYLVPIYSFLVMTLCLGVVRFAQLLAMTFGR